MYNAMPPQIDWLAILPVMIVSGTGVLALLPEIIAPKRNNTLIVLISLIGLVAAGGAIVHQYGQTLGDSFGGMVQSDTFGLTMQLLVVGATFIAILFSEGYLREKRIPF